MNVFAVICTYNAAKWIRTCLDSLLHSSIIPEIIIIDNCSTDDTLAILESEFGHLKILRNKVNYGFGKANNTGIRYALSLQADYIFLINQDAYVFENTLHVLIERIRKHPQFIIVSPMHLDGSRQALDYHFSEYAGPGNCPGLFSDLIVRPYEMKDVYETKFVNAALWLMTKEGILKIGGFDPVFPHYGEDNDLVNRASFHGFKIGICPNVYGVHDRAQKPFDLKDLNLKKRYNRRIVGHLIRLKNINLPFIHSFITIVSDILKELLRNSIKLKFTFAFIEVKGLFFIISHINKIHKHRIICRYHGTHFL